MGETSAPAQRRRGRLPRPARRAQLLEAALEVFVVQGFHSAAMDDIADRAGVSKPVLYQHFPSKLDLYLALLESSCGAAVDAVRSALAATEDNKERVSATVDAFFTYVANDKAAFRLVFESDLTQEPAVRQLVEQVTTECATLVAAVIRDDTGLPEAASQLLAVSLVGMAQVSARYWLSGGIDVSQDHAVALVTALAWRGIAGYPRAGSPEAPATGS